VEPSIDFRSTAPDDCLIAAIAIRHGGTVVHRDAVFDVIGEMTDLVVTHIAPR
jgi:predicted nucleic acid-binding protein